MANAVCENGEIEELSLVDLCEIKALVLYPEHSVFDYPRSLISTWFDVQVSGMFHYKGKLES